MAVLKHASFISPCRSLRNLFDFIPNSVYVFVLFKFVFYTLLILPLEFFPSLFFTFCIYLHISNGHYVDRICKAALQCPTLYRPPRNVLSRQTFFFLPKTEFQSIQLTIDSVLLAITGANPPLWEPLYTGGVYHLFVESAVFVFFLNDLFNYLLFHSFITCL